MYLVGFAAAWWLARRRAARAGLDLDGERRRRFPVLRDAGRDPRRAHRLRAVLRPAAVARRLALSGQDLGRRHVLSRRPARRAGRRWRCSPGAAVARIADVFDFTAPLPGIGLFFGRIGNFINGELWGRPTDVPWAMLVPDPNGGPPVARHPSQLYEAAARGPGAVHDRVDATRAGRGRALRLGLFLLIYRPGAHRWSSSCASRTSASAISPSAGSPMGQMLSLPHAPCSASRCSCAAYQRAHTLGQLPRAAGRSSAA